MMSNEQIKNRISDLDDTTKRSEAFIRLLQMRYDALKDDEMRDLMASGRGIDVSIFPKTKQGNYLLPAFNVDKVYIDCFWQAYVRHIGATKKAIIEEMANGTWRILPSGSIIATWLAHTDYRLNRLF
jgi:hypothetical protein